MCMKHTKPGSSSMFYLNLIFTRDRLYASVLRHILGQFKCAGALEIMRLPPLPWSHGANSPKFQPQKQKGLI